MKAAEIRQMSRAEIVQRIHEEEENLVTMNFQHASSQLTNTSGLLKTRREIARMKSIVKEMDNRGDKK